MFLKILNKKKFVLLSVFLFIYLSLILFNGERGLISYFEKQKIKDLLIHENQSLEYRLALVEKKNSLLTDVIDIDYLEILYRKKFMLGNSNEKIYVK